MTEPTDNTKNSNSKEPSQNGKNVQGTGLPRPLQERDDGSPDPLQGILGTTPNCRYVKKRLLGQGSFGNAWRVEETSSKRVLAAKVMDLNAMNEKDKGFVTNEVKCLSRCNNPHIVRCEAAIEKDGILLIVMEYADGGDLYRQIKARQQSLRYFREHEVVFIFLQLCIALDHIHMNKMMHRDLKTANILLTTTGLVKLGDFGFSRQYEDSLSNPVGSTFCGTPYYLSPELWHRQPYSKKSEMWALGVVLYEIMALRRPFGGRSMDDLISNISQARRQPLPSSFSEQLRGVCDKLLSVDPKDRPSLRELFEDPFIRSNLQTLQRSVERHNRLQEETRKDISEAIKFALSGTQAEEKEKIQPKKGIVKRHTAGGGWQDCELELDEQSISMKTLETGHLESIPLSTITSACPIDDHGGAEKFVFAMKNFTGKAFWFQTKGNTSLNEWLSALQNAIL